MEKFISLGLEMLENKRLEGFWSDFLGLGLEYMAGRLLERFLGLGLEMFKNSSLEASWSDFCAWASKSLKIASWKVSGTIFGPGSGNA